MNNYAIIKKRTAKNLCFLVNGKRKQLRTEQIIYMEAIGNYTVIHLQNQDIITASFSLMFFDVALLGKSFIRIHDKYLVNSTWISQVWLKAENKSVSLKNGISLSISRRRSKDVASMWKLINQS